MDKGLLQIFWAVTGPMLDVMGAFFLAHGLAWKKGTAPRAFLITTDLFVVLTLSAVVCGCFAILGVAAVAVFEPEKPISVWFFSILAMLSFTVVVMCLSILIAGGSMRNISGILLYISFLPLLPLVIPIGGLVFMVEEIYQSWENGKKYRGVIFVLWEKYWNAIYTDKFIGGFGFVLVSLGFIVQGVYNVLY